MLLKSIGLKNILSFRNASIELRPLNVLIGPNGVGKSNLIEVISLLKAAPTDFNRPIVVGGGAREWISKANNAPHYADIECVVGAPPCAFFVRFTQAGGILQIQDEVLRGVGTRKKPFFKREGATVSFGSNPSSIPATESAFSRFKRPDDPTPITSLGRDLERIEIYRDFNTGPTSQARSGVSTNYPGETLEETGSNLAMVLHRLDFNGAGRRVTEYLKEFNENYETYQGTDRQRHRPDLHPRKTGLSAPVPAFRLSDGTLKFLCLLAVLFNTTAPSLVCIEEPELGLHPDALRLVAEALREASERMQIIVTTHSEQLVDALSPEDVIVCERGFDNGTRFERLNEEKLRLWLEKYSLGELWRKGEIGGNRW